MRPIETPALALEEEERCGLLGERWRRLPAPLWGDLDVRRRQQVAARALPSHAAAAVAVAVAHSPTTRESSAMARGRARGKASLLLQYIELQ